MKRILIFSIAYHPFVGGAEVAIKEITDRIPDIEFDMITLHFDSTLPAFERVGNVNVHRIGFTKAKPKMGDLIKFPLYLNKVLYPVTACFKAFSLHKTRNYDALWCMMSYMGFPALFVNWFKKIPIILTLQEGDSISQITGRKRIRIVYPLYKAIFKKAAIVQVISNYLAGFARDMGFTGKIEVISNGVDVSLFTEEFSEQELNLLKDKLGKKENDVFLITTSRLVPKNGVGDVISSLPMLPSIVKFLILGTGDLEVKLRKQARDLNVEDRVIFLGFVPHHEMPKYLKISDIFIRPSLSEGMGNSFIEAMAAKVPVIATPVGGIPDFLKDRETGLFCEVKNPQSIAERVTALIVDTTLRKKVISNAYILAISNYDWNLIARQMGEKIFLYV